MQLLSVMKCILAVNIFRNLVHAIFLADGGILSFAGAVKSFDTQSPRNAPKPPGNDGLFSFPVSTLFLLFSLLSGLSHLFPVHPAPLQYSNHGYITFSFGVAGDCGLPRVGLGTGLEFFGRAVSSLTSGSSLQPTMSTLYPSTACRHCSFLQPLSGL